MASKYVDRGNLPRRHSDLYSHIRLSLFCPLKQETNAWGIPYISLTDSVGRYHCLSSPCGYHQAAFRWCPRAAKVAADIPTERVASTDISWIKQSSINDWDHLVTLQRWGKNPYILVCPTVIRTQVFRLMTSLVLPVFCLLVAIILKGIFSWLVSWLTFS